MKQTTTIKYLITGMLIFIIGSCLFMYEQSKKQHTDIVSSQQPTQNFDTFEAIRKASAPLTETVLTPQTMAEIDEIYKDINMIEIPHIFIDRLPDDWKIEKTADKTLFMKIITALILRTNERIIQERTALHLLQEKYLKNIDWNEEETAFFNQMVKKYDSDLKRKKSAQFAELIDKINIIPPSLAVAQAIMFTDWGQKNQKSIYGEYGWRGEEAYEPIEFDSLIQATDSFALQLNSRSQLLRFREIRRYLIPMERSRHIGIDLMSQMDKFMEWDKDYINKLVRTYRQGKITELDWACFNGTCQIQKDDPSLELE